MDKKKILTILMEKYPTLDKEYLECIIDKFFQVIAHNIKESNRIEIRNFGVFKLRELNIRDVYNPHTSRLEKVSGKKVPFFKCSKNLHKINKSA